MNCPWSVDLHTLSSSTVCAGYIFHGLNYIQEFTAFLPGYAIWMDYFQLCACDGSDRMVLCTPSGCQLL